MNWRVGIEVQGIKAIKALVAFMAILLVAGLVLLGYGLMNVKPTTKKPAAAVASSVAGTDGDSFGTVVVPVPAGARVEQTLVVGEKVVLRLSGAGGERLLVLDPDDGTVSGAFVLTPEAPAGH